MASDVVLDISVKEEACTLNLAPTSSTAAALAMGDALAVVLAERRDFQEHDFAALHPGGRLGKKLRRIETLMHTGDDLPRVLPTTKMPDVIYEMSRKGLGLTAVTKPTGELMGIITDGDLRRVMQRRKQNVLDLAAIDCMTKKPGDVAAHGAGRGGVAADGREEDYVGDRGGQRGAARGRGAHPRPVDTAAILTILIRIVDPERSDATEG